MPEEPEVETEKLHEAIQEELERDSSQASDQWAYYQAKGVKGAVQEAVRASWLAAGKEPPASAEEKVARYEKEQEAIREKAVELEEEREAKVAESEHLLRGYHRFANAVALFQVAIALGAVAALTRSRMVWAGSKVVGLGRRGDDRSTEI